MHQSRIPVFALLLIAACEREQPVVPTAPPPTDASATPEPASQRLAPESSLTERFVQPPQPGSPPASELIPSPDAATVTVRDYHPNGWLYTERVEKLTPDGKRVRHGPLAAWFENRQLMFTGEYTDGKKSGRWVYWNDMGAREREGEQEDDRREGEWREWHANGQLKSQGLFHANLAEGPWKFWHDNGQLFAEGEFINNKREGQWMFWLPDGSVDGNQAGVYSAHQRVR